MSAEPEAEVETSATYDDFTKKLLAAADVLQGWSADELRAVRLPSPLACAAPLPCLAAFFLPARWSPRRRAPPVPPDVRGPALSAGRWSADHSRYQFPGTQNRCAMVGWTCGGVWGGANASCHRRAGRAAEVRGTLKPARRTGVRRGAEGPDRGLLQHERRQEMLPERSPRGHGGGGRGGGRHGHTQVHRVGASTSPQAARPGLAWCVPTAHAHGHVSRCRRTASGRGPRRRLRAQSLRVLAG